MGKLVGHVAIATGAGQGISRGIAVVFAKDGAKVAIADRNAETCAEVTEYIRYLGHAAIAIICDVGDSTQVEAIVKEVGDEYGSIDILVNNAQRYVPSRLSRVRVPSPAPASKRRPSEPHLTRFHTKAGRRKFFSVWLLPPLSSRIYQPF